MIKSLALFVLIILCAVDGFSKIWRVNNTGNGGGDFATAQAANDYGLVVDGDTIHIEPSPVSYGNLTPWKRLIWISTGAFIDVHTGEQYSLTPGKINNLDAGDSRCANSVFSLNIGGTVIIRAAGIRLERCYIETSVTIDGQDPNNMPNNIVIMNCFGMSYLYFVNSTNHLVTNNIFLGGMLTGTVASGVAQNNVLNGTGTSPYSISNFTLQNNIFNKTIGAYTFTNCVVQYNMSGSGGVLPAGNFNQNNVAMANVFVNNSGTNDAAFVLKAGSPAIASGAAGANMGAYGGTTPFKTALQPAVPAIYKITAPFVPAGNTMNVTFSTKSNN